MALRAIDAATGPRLVVLRALKLGDVLTGVPALRALRRRFPRHRLVVAGPGALAEVVHLARAADDVVNVPGLRPLPRSLHQADLAVNLHGKGPLSSALLARTSPRRLVAYYHPDVPETTAGSHWRHHEHETQRWCRLLIEAGIPADPTDMRLPPPSTAPLPGSAGAVLVHPGASSPARRWPPERWASLVRALTADGRRVLITGSRSEYALGQSIAGLAAPAEPIVVAGEVDLLGMFSTVANADLVVCGDTGIAHAASAFSTPSVVLFGPDTPQRWGPPASGPHTVLWKGHTGDPHAQRPDPGLLALTVNEVLNAAHHRLKVSVVPHRQTG